MIKAVFFDIDGTLVSFKTHRVPESARKSVRALREKGVKVFIASGRRMNSIDNLGDLEFDGFVTANGSQCQVGDRIIHARYIDRKDVEALAGSGLSLPWGIVQQEQIYVNTMNREVRKVFDLLRFRDPVVGPLSGVIDGETIQLLVFMKKGEEGPVMKYLPDCEAVRWHPLFCDVIPKGSGKNVGIDKMLEYFGIDRSETMAFGDGGNDISMLEHVAVGVAMGNAEKEVKKVASYVTRSVDDNGIEKALRHYGLL